MAGECGTAVAAAAAGSMVTTLTNAAVENFMETDWRGNSQQKRMIEKAANRKAVLGPGKAMKLQEYANSPIIQQLKDHALPSSVNVACVPSGMGKTTACQAFMDKYVKKGKNRGLCFSPYDFFSSDLNKEERATFLYHMIVLLGFNISTVPPGLLGLLLTSLEPDCKSTPSYLFLDDFMPDGPTTRDLDLIIAIKTLVRNKLITVIALTSNQKSADLMLTMNNFVGIRPPLEPPVVFQLKEDFNNGYSRKDPNYHLDWNHYMDIEWPLEELRKAARAQEFFKGIPNLDDHVDTIVLSLSQDQRKKLSPAEVIQLLSQAGLAVGHVQTFSNDDDELGYLRWKSQDCSIM